MKNIKFGNTNVGLKFKPFIIAELSGNHNRSLARALDIVEAASAAGASCIKLQTFRPEEITLDLITSDFMIDDENSIWDGRSLDDLYREAETPWEWHKPIFDKAKSLNLEVFSSVFSEAGLEFLESLDVCAYKIASQECCDIPLVTAVAQTGKPLIISTGMASLAQVSETVDAVKSTGNKGLVLLKCTSNYPADPNDSNVLTVRNMRENFDCEVGLSDHTMGVGAALAAIAHGATVVEKHFTLSRADGGIDSEFSLEPAEMRSLAIESERAWQSLGCVHYGPVDNEIESLKYRRSLYAVEDIKKGERFTSKNIRSIRPGFGLEPKFLNIVLEKVAKKHLSRGHPISWDVVG